MDREAIERKCGVSRREGARLLLDIMLTRSREQCVEFCTVVRETVGLQDLGERMLKDLDEDMTDSRDKRTIVGEVRQVKREKQELLEKNQSLSKENKKLRLLNIEFEMDKAGSEWLSVM
jgi:hypothetical protein